jgi:hypothetical protein
MGSCNEAEVVAQRQPLDGNEKLVGSRLILDSVVVVEMNGK